MLVYLDTTNKRILRTKNCSKNTPARRSSFDVRTAVTTDNWFWEGRGKTTSTEQFLCRKSPLGISNKLLDHKKRCVKKY